jgi:hypothetical protein
MSVSSVVIKVRPMTRFFFNLASKDNTVFDDKGRDLIDLAAAHRHAMLLIHKMVALDDVDWRGWSINVADASQRSVLSVLFPQSYAILNTLQSDLIVIALADNSDTAYATDYKMEIA